jgi:hypothetical protein
MSSATRKPEDSSEGCRSLERDSRERAAETTSEHMRTVLERSADAWSARAQLLSRLERNFLVRAVEIQGDRPRPSNEEVADNG